MEMKIKIKEMRKAREARFLSQERERQGRDKKERDLKEEDKKGEECARGKGETWRLQSLFPAQKNKRDENKRWEKDRKGRDERVEQEKRMGPGVFEPFPCTRTREMRKIKRRKR